MKIENSRTPNQTTPCYGGFAERWKYDDYTRRKDWFKRNRTKLMTLAGVCCVLAVTALFLLIK